MHTHFFVFLFYAQTFEFTTCKAKVTRREFIRSFTPQNSISRTRLTLAHTHYTVYTAVAKSQPKDPTKPLISFFFLSSFVPGKCSLKRVGALQNLRIAVSATDHTTVILAHSRGRDNAWHDVPAPHEKE